MADLSTTSDTAVVEQPRLWSSPDSQSRALYDRAMKVMPGGITRTMPWQDPWPVYARGGSGAYVTDVEGVRRLDLLNNFASLIHGHAYPPVVEAVREVVGCGTAFTLPTEAEVALAETICARAESFEWIRFCNSGSEGVMSAVKAARAHTGRSRIVKAEGTYHGSYDYAEVSLDPTPDNWGNEPRSVGYAQGTPKGVTDDVIVIPFNDTETAERIIRTHADEIAAVLIDAAPSFYGFVQIAPDFADMIRRVTREIGALFILDEVITFRVHEGGAQTLFGIDPDLTVLAKIIGGGFPVGAVVGRREFMQVYDHRQGRPALPWSGTFTGNPVTMTAGRVTLEHYRQAEVDRLDALGDMLREGVAAAFRETGFPGQITGFSSMFSIFGHDRPVTDYRTGYATPEERKRFARLQAGLVVEGFHIATTGKAFLSTPMTEADVNAFVAAVRHICAEG